MKTNRHWKFEKKDKKRQLSLKEKKFIKKNPCTNTMYVKNKNKGLMTKKFSKVVALELLTGWDFIPFFICIGKKSKKLGKYYKIYTEIKSFLRIFVLFKNLFLFL